LGFPVPGLHRTCSNATPGTGTSSPAGARGVTGNAASGRKRDSGTQCRNPFERNSGNGKPQPRRGAGVSLAMPPPAGKGIAARSAGIPSNATPGTGNPSPAGARGCHWQCRLRQEKG